MNKHIRIRLEDGLNNRSYITVNNNGNVGCFTGGDIPQALSNLVGKNAAELRFALEDIGLEIGSSALANFEALEMKALRVIKNFCPGNKDYQIL